jgi:alkylation response protein AidB-like acyl-CoA dehydrogenase
VNGWLLTQKSIQVYLTLMLSFELGDELSQLQTTVHDFAVREIRPALRTTEQSGPSPALRGKFEELGLLTLDWPEAAGGAALSALYRAIVEEELAFGDVGTAFALDRGGAAAVFLKALGTEVAYGALKGLSEGPGRAAFATGEDGKAQDDFQTVAQKSGDGWTLTGRKPWVFGGGDAAFHLVLAQVEPGAGLQGAGAFLVRGGQGVRAGKTWTTCGLGGLPLREVHFENVKLPASGRLDTPGKLPQVLRAFYDVLSITTAARAVGTARASYEYALAYANERQAFGKPIGHFQAVAFLLADMATATDAARWLTWKAAWQLGQGGGTGEAAAAQAQALEAAFFCANMGVQVLGGAGYVQDHPSEKWMRDAKTLSLYGQHAQAASATLAAVELGKDACAPELFPVGSLHAALS